MTTQRLLPVLAAGTCALILAGCTTDNSTTDSTNTSRAAVAPATQAPESNSGDSASAESHSADAGAATPMETPPAADHDATDGGACATSQLNIDLTDMQGAAGSRLADITFTNTSSTPCSLNGFPGVSAVTNDDGTQLGAAAERESGQETSTITLEPGHSARAGLKMTNVGVLDPASCQPQAANGLRVYPPGETASAFIRVEGLEGCAGDATYLSIQPVTAN